eukprot:gnl/TRDRNA2_/TRDRNA2_155598_c1_seq2.p1 gnl/TRDRNA2_/TRDRNA2_155598_c1~~gnl/TRDRNA2_/TRDRNA2_155598_c1_seq2.p1  ORF type:complete len:161 (-),score=27.99 gnl/TRDRNA2_/TRDRNA2_155598_c1_seq2:219-677(-)
MAAAVVDVLLGRASPAGRLPCTWPRRLEEATAVVAAAEAPPPLDASPFDAQYSEGLGVGYRGSGTRRLAAGHGPMAAVHVHAPPRFAFGHGLAYTRFDYEAAAVKLVAPCAEERGPLAAVSVRVRNIGDKPGAEVAQVYVEADGLPKALRAC